MHVADLAGWLDQLAHRFPGSMALVPYLLPYGAFVRRRAQYPCAVGFVGEPDSGAFVIVGIRCDDAEDGEGLRLAASAALYGVGRPCCELINEGGPLTLGRMRAALQAFSLRAARTPVILASIGLNCERRPVPSKPMVVTSVALHAVGDDLAIIASIAYQEAPSRALALVPAHRGYG
jgi:hypothetical protein